MWHALSEFSRQSAPTYDASSTYVPNLSSEAIEHLLSDSAAEVPNVERAQSKARTWQRVVKMVRPRCRNNSPSSIASIAALQDRSSTWCHVVIGLVRCARCCDAFSCNDGVCVDQGVPCGCQGNPLALFAGRRCERWYSVRRVMAHAC